MYCTKCGRKITEDTVECLFCNPKEIQLGKSEQNSEYGSNPYGQNPYGLKGQHRDDCENLPHNGLNKNLQNKTINDERSGINTRTHSQANNKHQNKYNKNDDWWGRNYDYDSGELENHNENEYYDYKDGYGRYRFLKLIIILGVLFIPNGWIVGIVGGIILAILKRRDFLRFGLLLAICSFLISVLFFNSHYSWYFYRESQTIFNMILSLIETVSNMFLEY